MKLEDKGNGKMKLKQKYSGKLKMGRIHENKEMELNYAETRNPQGEEVE